MPDDCLSLLTLAAGLIRGSDVGQAPGLGDEHDPRAGTAEHAVNGIDRAFHHRPHVSIERGLAQPQQARLQRFLINMHDHPKTTGQLRPEQDAPPRCNAPDCTTGQEAGNTGRWALDVSKYRPLRATILS